MIEYLVEACVDTVTGALAAEQGGARRIELCSDLSNGGTTPSAGAIQLALARLKIPIHVMIRPRAGDFVFDDLELEEMALSIRYAKNTGAAGVVLGLLTPDGSIDRVSTRRLVDIARPMSVTFHRAFDLVIDPYRALDTLIELGVERILTSGQEPTAFEGVNLIAELIRRAKDRIIIMPGAGINEDNIAGIAQLTGARELHLSGRTEVASAMQGHAPRIHLNGASHPPNNSRLVTSAHRIEACVHALSRV